ncbi:hypothetical protein Glove_396g91 [Diversispora epigaea]|uniref:Uncharacterized protein n=1 Tax=Diversispora epigaea TaxID=1348612 RepID=A0A397H5B2_9GLOM|nr:hypothetical protein Glove_396g91 [Diversispora epigaea]
MPKRKYPMLRKYNNEKIKAVKKKREKKNVLDEEFQEESDEQDNDQEENKEIDEEEKIRTRLLATTLVLKK